MAEEATAPTDKNKADGAATEEVVEKKPKRKIKRLVKFGRVYITAGFNNTLLTATDPQGNVLARSSAGASGFKGAKKSTPYAAQVAAERLAEKLDQFGMEHLEVFLKGVGPGREQGIRGLAKNFDVDLIVDRTGLPHNGCRPKKRRRV